MHLSSKHDPDGAHINNLFKGLGPLYPYKEHDIGQIWAAKNKNKKIRGAQNCVASLKNIYS